MNFFTRSINRMFKKSISISFGSGSAMWGQWSANEAMKKYRSSAWIYSAVNLRASAVASVPWVVQKRTSEGWEDTENKEIESLLERPNSMMDKTTFMKMTILHLDLTGNAYWRKIRRTAGGKVLELWPILPTDIAPNIENGKLKNYMMNTGGTIEADDIVHLMYTAPDSLYNGVSPLQSASRAADIDAEAENWQKTSMENRAVPDGVMIFEDVQSESQYELARESVKKHYEGALNARRPMVLGGRAKWQSLSQTAVEMDYTNTRKFTREEILAVFGVPQPMVGVYENATLANIETARKIFWRDTIVPLLSEIESEMNYQLIYNEFGDDLRLRHDVSDIEAMQDSYTETVNTAKTLWGMGLPFNDINKRLELGFDEIPAGDVGYLPGGLIPTDIDLNLEGATMDNSKELSMIAYGKASEQIISQ